MVVVTGVQGSAPRDAGTRMLVDRGGLAGGTIGGGNLEKLAIEHAQKLLAEVPNRSEAVSYPLAEKTGQCCGGQVHLFYETFHWQRRTVAVFGAGHVGQALAELGPWMKADVVLIDGREESELQPPLAPVRPYELRCVDVPVAEIDHLPEEALVVIMTHDHALDLEILERALGRSFPFLGLIGSARKWARFQKRLAQRGFAPDRIASITCPIGLSQASKDPAAIALSTATQLVEVLERTCPKAQPH